MRARPWTDARDAALAQGVVANGLPLLFKRPTYAAADEIPQAAN